MEAHQAHAAALAALPGVGVRRLRMLLDLGDPVTTWQMVREGAVCQAGIPDQVVQSWRGVDSELPSVMRERCEQSGTWVVTERDPHYPALFADDGARPAVLFGRGSLDAINARRVAIIGTRNATAFGRHFARTLGAELARERVAVVSGLARGIDVASHLGAVNAGGVPVGVVASGLDVVYPREHKNIWRQVGETGLLITEAPPGTPPERFRFPQRNRVIAQLAEILVVVESRAQGGSMTTVREAMMRNIPVMAVPGHPSAVSAEGTNLLIADGCHVVTSVDDVFTALSISTAQMLPRVDPRRPPSQLGHTLVGILRDRPQTVDALAIAAGVDVLDVAVEIGRLEADGWVEGTNGWWEALTARA